MTSMCSLLDDWENCTTHHPEDKPKPKQPETKAHNSTGPGSNVTPGIPTPSQEKKDQCCEVIRQEIHALHQRADTDRQIALALTSAIIILLVMQITAQVRLDNMFNRQVRTG